MGLHVAGLDILNKNYANLYDNHLYKFITRDENIEFRMFCMA